MYAFLRYIPQKSVHGYIFIAWSGVIRRFSLLSLQIQRFEVGILPSDFPGAKKIHVIDLLYKKLHDFTDLITN
jgi:hypothetical protein